VYNDNTIYMFLTHMPFIEQGPRDSTGFSQADMIKIWQLSKTLTTLILFIMNTHWSLYNLLKSGKPNVHLFVYTLIKQNIDMTFVLSFMHKA